MSPTPFPRSLRALAAPTLALLPLATALPACGEDGDPIRGDRLAITPAAVTADSVANLRTLANELWSVQRWLYGSDSVGTLEDVLGMSAEAPIEVSGGALFLPDDELDFQQFLDDAEQFLRERAFTASQVESQSADEVTYRLDPDIFCAADWDPDLLEACQDTLTRLEVRFRVVSFAEGDLDVTMLVGPERAAAIQVELHHDVGSIELQVAPSLHALEVVLDAGAEPDVAAAEITGTGAFRLVVRRLADQQVRLSAEVTAAITLAVTQDGDTLALELGQGSVAVDLDAAAERGTADIDLGRIAVSGPKDFLAGVSGSGGDCVEVTTIDADGNETSSLDCPPEEETPPLEGTFAFELGKAAAYFDFTDADRRLDLRGLVFGPAKLVIDQQTVLEGTLDDGHTSLDLHAVLVGDDTLSLSTSRAMDAGLLLRLGLAPDAFEGVEDTFYADEDLGVAVAGAAPEAIVTGDGVYMASGSVTLTSKHAKNPSLVIAEGMCAWYADSDVSVEIPGTGSGDPAVPVDGGADESSDPHLFDLEVGDTCGGPGPT